MNAVATSGTRRHQLTVAVAYNEEDVERAAESFNVSLSDEETEAVLLDVDAELSTLVQAAAHSAVASRIYDDLARVARGHSWSDDD
jgi:hypothetical protein